MSISKTSSLLKATRWLGLKDFRSEGFMLYIAPMSILEGLKRAIESLNSLTDSNDRNRRYAPFSNVNENSLFLISGC